MLTELKLRRLRAPEGKRVEYWDKGGLGIRVGKGQSWVFKYSFYGKRRLITLGTYPEMSLSEARREAAEARLKVKRGIDPGVEKKAAREAHKAAPTIEEALGEFFDRELWRKKSGTETRRLLRHDVLPVWGGRKVADIKRRDVVLLLDKIRERAPITANRVHSALTRLFNFSAERGIIDDSPCTRIKKPKEISKSRALSDEEIKKLWKGLDPENKTVDAYALTKLALKLVLLTGQRPGEVVGMTWEELTPEGFWTIPAGRMKGAEVHRVPLSPMALDIIEQARTYSDGSPYVFRSTHKGGSPITPGSLSRAVLRHRKEMELEEPFTPHDLRRTLRTRLAEIGVSDIVAERVLGHKLQGVLGIYNRHPYDKEKREALELWEKRLRLIVGLDKPERAKVIPIKG